MGQLAKQRRSWALNEIIAAKENNNREAAQSGYQEDIIYSFIHSALIY